MTLKQPIFDVAPEPAAEHPAAGFGGDYRSGTAARLAGLPVETLRVWERRYGISDTARSARGQRLYSERQVRRLSLIKQLVDQGHGVGTLAKLSDEQLRALLPASLAGPPSARPRRCGWRWSATPWCAAWPPAGASCSPSISSPPAPAWTTWRA